MVRTTMWLATLIVACGRGHMTTSPTRVELAQQMIARQLTADLEVASTQPSKAAIDPDVVLTSRIDTVGAGLRLLWFDVIGVSSQPMFSVLDTDTRYYRLSGFNDSQVLEAWSELITSGKLNCDQVIRVVTEALDSSGGVHTVFGEWASQTATLAWRQFAGIKPDTWPNDSTVRYSGGLQLRIVTTLSSDGVDPSPRLWQPSAYAFVLSDGCVLQGWHRRLGPRFGVH